MKEIRAALGDRPDSPRFIQTLPRRGYRFLLEVHANGWEKRPPGFDGATTAAETEPVKPALAAAAADPDPDADQGFGDGRFE